MIGAWFLNIAWLWVWGDYRCLSQQRKIRAALKEPLFQCRQHTESYWDLFTCRPVCFLIMWVRENPSRQREKREREREKRVSLMPHVAVSMPACQCVHSFLLSQSVMPLICSRSLLSSYILFAALATVSVPPQHVWWGPNTLFFV